MPVTPKYPGVYNEKAGGKVHVITGVSTSSTVFIGWASKGPTDRAAFIESWADCERMYGGLNAQSYLGYAVQQFFNNGGKKAYVLRLVDKTSSAPASIATTTLQAGGSNVLKVSAKDEGAWGRSISISKKQRVPPDSSRFGLAVSCKDPNGQIRGEAFENLSMDPVNSSFVESVVNRSSALINVSVVGGPPAPNPPDDVAGIALTNGGADGSVFAPNDGNFENALATALSLLDSIDVINLIVVPGETTVATIAALEAYANKRRAIVLVDAASTDTVDTLHSGPNGAIVSPNGANAAFFFPWLKAPDPLDANQSHAYPPSGSVAGVIVRIDESRGFWKAPAGISARITGATDVAIQLTDFQGGSLNGTGISCIRKLPNVGVVIWGARTLAGADTMGSIWKYLPVRRLALYLEESLYRATNWVVFEPNDELLWSAIRMNVGAFMHTLFSQGAFQGVTPHDAYYIKCDSETTSQNDIENGIVNIVVGFAPLRPAEFVIIRIQQIAARIQP
jgi:phage tail sheath protein FI